MEHSRPDNRPVWLRVEYWLSALVAVALVAVGIAFKEQPWSRGALGAGVAAALVFVVALPLRSWMTAVYGTLLAASGGTIAVGALHPAPVLLGTGVLALIVVAASIPLAALLRILVHRPAEGGESRLGGLYEVMNDLREHSMLSDNAKRVLYRERELGLLRDAIETDIAEGKYNVGLTLCDEMADVFGYREEAEAFRSRILQSRQQRYESDVRGALANFDELLIGRDWAMVHQEAARIRRLYGDSHLVEDLDHRILQARKDHKQELEERFLLAAQRDDVEKAMGLLKELDRYLDPHEAQRLSEVAQGVVVRHRENLGVQFKLAVNDHRWAEALRIGEVIVDEFPNTKMADEVRSMTEMLRSRAEQASLTGASEPGT